MIHSARSWIVTLSETHLASLDTVSLVTVIQRVYVDTVTRIVDQVPVSFLRV